MYKRFGQFRENRDTLEFGKKFDELCLTIATSGIPFHEWWAQNAVPNVREGVSTDEELLEELYDAGKWALNKMFSGLKAGSQWWDKRQTNQKTTQSQTQPPQSLNNPTFGTVNLKNLSPEEFQQVKSSMDEVKKSFNRSLQLLKNQYEKQQNSMGAQVVSQFMDRVNKYADKVKFRSQAPTPSVQQQDAMAQGDTGYSQYDAMPNYDDAQSYDTGQASDRSSGIPRYKPMDIGHWR